MLMFLDHNPRLRAKELYRKPQLSAEELYRKPAQCFVSMLGFVRALLLSKISLRIVGNAVFETLSGTFSGFGML
jgi:hypothetical protein